VKGWYLQVSHGSRGGWEGRGEEVAWCDTGLIGSQRLGMTGGSHLLVREAMAAFEKGAIRCGRLVRASAPLVGGHCWLAGLVMPEMEEDFF
jgi:hypothetical protein